MIHQVVSRFFILGFGSEQQRNQYLPALAQGTMTASLAISEPGVGAHPRHLNTSAPFREGQYILTGEKSYLTNGPFADLFIVLAVTGATGGKKEFTAFLLPRETPGCSLTEVMKLDILRPSPHCGLRLDHCALPETQILGEKGTAYRKLAIPFREIEDCLLMGPAIGGMRAQMELVLAALKQGTVVPSDEVASELGGLESLIHLLRTGAYETATLMDSAKNEPEFLPLLLSLRSLARDFQSRLGRLMAGPGIQERPAMTVLTRDILSIVNLAQNVSLIKQKRIGEALLSGKD
jgi:acyl-CoA dehydrogenase